MVKNRAWNALAKVLLIFNTVVLAMILFLAGWYFGNKNSFLIEANRKGDIMIIRK